MSAIRIDDLRIEPSPRQPGMVRLSVRARYPTRLWSIERIWFEVPEALAADTSPAGDPWLVCLLPVAVSLGVPLVLALPVDDRLLSNSARLMDLWHTWYPQLKPIPVEASSLDEPHPPRGHRTGLLFSGGVDSFFTLLQTELAPGPKVDELLLLHGFDIPLQRRSAFEKIHHRLAAVGASLGKPLIPVASNLRQTRFEGVNWTDVGHGSFLAAAALLLAPRYRQVLISSGAHPGHMVPIGTHPEQDPLFSTRQTMFEHFGATVSRIEKVAFLSNHPVAFDNLWLCYNASSGVNCGRCLKCTTAMLILEVMGKLEHCQSFPGDHLNLDLIRRTYMIRSESLHRIIQAFALERGRADVAEAIETAFQRTARLDRWLLLGHVRRLRHRLRHHTGLRLATHQLRGWTYDLGLLLNRLLP
jgi:hypothetical protein